MNILLGASDLPFSSPPPSSGSGTPRPRTSRHRRKTAGAPAAELQWPRVIEDGGVTFTVYQPQIDKFDDAVLEARAAVQVETGTGDKKQTSYGVIWITANTSIDKESELVQLDDIQITKANFPTAGDKTEEYLEVFRRNVEQGRTISLARVEANLAIAQADKKGNAVPLKNDPPTIYYRTSPAILIMIDGDPVLRAVEGSGLQRVLNTRGLLLQDSSSYYMPLGDRWLTSNAVTGPWRMAASVPPNAQTMRDALAKDEQSQTDLMDDPGDDVKALLAQGKIPEIIVSTVPAELVVTQGKPDMKPIAGTQLLYVANTTGDILLDLKDQNYYVPLTGRWFRAKSLEGPWQFVDGADLPKDFAKIPTENPKASVLATVPGTPAAQEAVIANSIPQTAEVNREEAKFEPSYDGQPQFENVPDTSLQYAANTPTPVIRIDPTSYYAVQGGVWFSSASPVGPWIVATAVPPVIYTIPTASPIHYVTYVRIYRYSPTYVWVGYTPGYMGTCYSPWGTVVYGTGWYYRPWIGRYWYGAPMTWGFGVGISWNPWSGWNVGFGWGGYRPYYRPYWGPYYGWHRVPGRYYGRPVPTPYGRPPGMSITNVNVYNRPGIARPGVRPAPRPAPLNRRCNPGARLRARVRLRRPAADPRDDQPIDASRTGNDESLDSACAGSDESDDAAGSGHHRSDDAARTGHDGPVDTARAFPSRQRLRREGRQRVPAATRRQRMGDQRPGQVEARPARDATGSRRGIAPGPASDASCAAAGQARSTAGAPLDAAEPPVRGSRHAQPALARSEGPRHGQLPREPSPPIPTPAAVQAAFATAAGTGAAAEEAVGGGDGKGVSPPSGRRRRAALCDLQPRRLVLLPLDGAGQLDPDAAEGIRGRLPPRRLGHPATSHPGIARRAGHHPRGCVLRDADLAHRLLGASGAEDLEGPDLPDSPGPRGRLVDGVRIFDLEAAHDGSGRRRGAPRLTS